MPTFKSAMRACALAIGILIAQGDAAAQFNQFYFFGDSLTDAGWFKPVLPPAPAYGPPIPVQSGRRS